MLTAEVEDGGGDGDDDCGGTGVLITVLFPTADGMSLPDVDFTNSSAVRMFTVNCTEEKPKITVGKIVIRNINASLT